MERFHPNLDKRRQNEKKLYKRLSKSSDDLREAQQIAEYILDKGLSDVKVSNGEARLLQRALNVALVVCYSRPFGDNRGHDFAKPTLPEKYLRVYDQAERDLHDVLIDKRNQEYAHSQGDQFFADVLKSGSMLIPIITDRYVPLNREELELLVGMINKLGVHIEKKRQELEPRVYMRYGDYDVPPAS